MAYLLIDTLGSAKASSIISATGAIYVIPFLLFSSTAGILADRFSKQKLLVLMKIAEMTVMILAIFAFSAQSVWGCFTLLFILATHSATFGPSKYGIIPELVPVDAVSRANGIITSFTYLAIIIGTFLASFLTEITNRGFVVIAVICFFIAVGGFFSALSIKPTAAQASNKKINPLFIREIYKTLKRASTIPHLLMAIFGSSFFLMIGGFTQLNIIPFAMQSLQLPELAGGYLFLACALGIALGSFIAGRVSKKRIELGLSCMASFGIGIFLIVMSIFSTSMIWIILSLIFIGILGGMYTVPLDTFIQVRSGEEMRGQTIGATNFLSFFGVLLASFSIYFFNEICGLSAATSFGIVGAATLCFSLLLCIRFSDLFLSLFARLFLFRRFKKPDVADIEKSPTILVLENASWREGLLLAGMLPNVHFFIPAGSKYWRWYFALLYSVHRVPKDKVLEKAIDHTKGSQEGMIPCLMLEEAPLKKTSPLLDAFFQYFKRGTFQTLIVRPMKDEHTRRTTFTFEKK